MTQPNGFIDPLMSAPRDQAGLARRRIRVADQDLYIRYDVMEKYSDLLGIYEIMSGVIYPIVPGGWNAARKYTCGFNMRLYDPYASIDMSLSPSMKRFSTEMMITRVPFKLSTESVQITLDNAIGKFYTDFLALFRDKKISDFDIPF